MALRACVLGHEVRGRTPWSLRILMHFEHWVQSDNGYAQWLSATWLTLAFGVMRFAHLQRSKVLEIGEDFILGRASVGKSRRGGVRRPFRWAAPRFSLRGVDLGAVLRRLLEAAGPQEADRECILLDFGPPGAPFAKVVSTGCRPMPLGRFHSLSRQLLQLPPASLELQSAAKVSSYTGRRLLPTLSDILRFSTDERLKIGGWGKAEEVERVSSTMPDVYSHNRLEVAARVKGSILDEVVRQLAVEGDFPEALLDRPWPALLHPRGEGLPDPRPRRAGPTSGEMGRSSLQEVWEADTSSPSSSPSSASSSATTRSSSTSPEPPFSWLKAAGVHGRLHLPHPTAEASRGGRIPTLCGRALFSPQVGEGVSDALAAGTWSPRCKARLPSRVRARWES